MPSRILRDWTDSDPLDGISAEAERLFVRLLMKADDYGRFHAESRRVKAACFPLLPNLRTTDIDGWLRELAERRLILRYQVENRDLLAIPRFRQRLKNSIPRFPAPADKPNDWLPDPGKPPDVPGSSGNVPEVPASSLSHLPLVLEASLPASGGDEILSQARRYIADHRRLTNSPAADAALAKLVRAYGWDKTKEAVETAIANGAGKPIPYAAQILDGKAAKELLANMAPARPRPVSRVNEGA